MSTPAPPPPLPRYGEASLSDLLPSLLAALDVPGQANPLGVEPLRRACLLVVDGLGWELLLANRRAAPVMAAAAERGGPVTTGFPSTTSSSLASIGTGLPPGRHGLVGYTIALPGMDRAFNCLRWSPYGLGGAKDLRDRVVPERIQPEPTAFEAAAADGVEVTLVGAGEYAASGFTRAALRGGDYWRTHSLGDQAAGALRGLGKGRRSLVYLYHPDLDRPGHVRGAGAEAWRLELAHIDQRVGQIAERLGGDAALFVTGDHGMVDLRPEQRVDLADQPELAAGVRLLAGEARARHVHTQRGAAADVLATWRGLLGHAMWVVSGEEAI
ncbi:MAG TPA: alkaline phosphatase family protein, partial [Actinomycetes bacterium]|nr:alkaline phosphatase family protein [Actinomycetes bacterium]